MPKDKPIPSSVRFFVLQRDGFACRYCGKGVSDGAILELDHVHPRSKGGPDTADNLIAACQGCNNGKRAAEGVIPPEPALRAATPGLRGKCIAEMHDKEVGAVAIIRDEIPGGFLLIQYFNAFHGEPSTMRLIETCRLLGTSYILFEDLDHMNAWLEANDQ